MSVRNTKQSALFAAPLYQRTSFKTSYIDLNKGIRVGHLDDHARLSWLLKNSLKEIFREEFLVDRWGRGSYWEHIWFTPQNHWKLKNIKGRGHFESAKYFVSVDSERKEFRVGVHIESGYSKSKDNLRYQRNAKWDWNRFITALEKDEKFHQLLEYFINKDEFQIQIGFSEDKLIIKRWQDNAPILSEIKRRLRHDWVVVQFYFPFHKTDLSSMSGGDLLMAISGVMIELASLINVFLEVPLNMYESAMMGHSVTKNL